MKKRSLTAVLSLMLAACAGPQSYDTSIITDGFKQSSSSSGNETPSKDQGNDEYINNAIAEVEGGQKQGGEASSATLEFANGVYQGEVLGGKPHGAGELQFNDGTVYRGDFRRGFMSGQGEIVYPDGSRYKGQLRNDRAEGKGVAVSADGKKLKGTFDNGKLVKGQLKLASGDVYHGRFENGRLNGEGKLVAASGGTYEGTFDEGKRTGVFVYSDDGEQAYQLWRDGKKVFSTVGPDALKTSVSGCSARGNQAETLKVAGGNCSGGALSGEGVAYHQKTGTIYDGRFRDGRMVKGAVFTAAGDLRRGEWRDGRLHGQGKIYEDAALVYDGGFNQGQRDGEGVCVIDGSPEKCEYHQGDRVDRLWMRRQLEEDLASLDEEFEEEMDDVRADIQNQRERFERRYQNTIDGIEDEIDRKKNMEGFKAGMDMLQNQSYEAQQARAAQLGREVDRLERKKARLKEEHAREARQREREWEREQSSRIDDLQREYRSERAEIVDYHREKCEAIPGKRFTRGQMCVDG